MTQLVFCGCCGHGTDEARLLIQFSYFALCDECIEMAWWILRERARDAEWERLKDYAP